MRSPWLLADPLVDENILLQAEKGNLIAIDFLEKNRGLIATGGISKLEYLSGGKGREAQFMGLINKHGVVLHENIPGVLEEAASLIRRAEAAGTKLGVKDSIHLAGSNKLGIPLYTNDLQFFKRGKDLGGQ